MFSLEEIAQIGKSAGIKDLKLLDPAVQIKGIPANNLAKKQPKYIAKHIAGISTDSRAIAPGELFIPLKGPRFDGRKFAKAALQKGACVANTKNGLKLLQALATAHRKKFNLPVIGITGSAGKTTTKDMLAAILNRKFPALKNEENFNNEIGVPKTLLQLAPKHHAAVIEMAMQGRGEISQIAEIASPTIALITNIGEAHLKQLKNRKNIASAKSEIIDHLPRGGYVILNTDDDFYRFLIERVLEKTNLLCCGKKANCNCDTSACGLHVVSFGIKNKAFISPHDSTVAALLKNLPLPGEHNIYNALAAIAAAKIIGLTDKQIAAGLRKFETSQHRMKIIKRHGITIIDDTYNANPSSMKAALEALGSRVKGIGFRKTLPLRRVAILGDMLELGSRTVKYHKAVGKFAGEQKIDMVIGVGKLAEHIVTAAKKCGVKTCHFESAKAAAGKAKKLIKSGDTILIKASRGMKLEALILPMLS
jgi:UDP-N-acetylmuramoyl-tripeptide--D-alanyl-D-alanine ligase